MITVHVYNVYGTGCERMKEPICEERLCTGCGACFQVCPQGAVSMLANNEGFLHPHINEELCNDCGLCTRTCPINKTEDTDAAVQQKAYAFYCRDEGVRAASSSGGAFSQLAMRVLSEGGVVFGAGFDSQFRVRHTCINSERDLDSLRRSKYVQSDTGNTFTQVKTFLKEGKKVLYCGTPCQIAGLKAYLNKETPALLTCDLACHGVPSPKVWSMYLDYIKSKHQSDIKAVSFRDKSTGWKDSSMRIDFADGSRYMDKVKREIFFIGFGKSIFNRKSCFDCKFRVANTKADITLADFWGINKQEDSVFHDNKGVSLVIAHTARGEAALSRISDGACIKEGSFDEAVRYNPRLISSVNEPAGRKDFFDDMYAGYSFNRLRRKYMDNESILYKVKCLVKKVLGRV